MISRPFVGLETWGHTVAQNTRRKYVGIDQMTDLAEVALLSPEEILASTPSALLLVDIQNRFAATRLDDGTYESLAVVAPIERLLFAARSMGVPRFFVTVASHVNGPWEGANDTAPWLRRISDISGADRAEQLHATVTVSDQEIIESLRPVPGEVWLHKQRFSAFYETGLEMALRSRGIETLVVCGVASYGCIYMTCLDANFRGFFSFVPGEATAGENPVLHEAAMTMIGHKNVIDVETVERAWAAASKGNNIGTEVMS